MLARFWTNMFQVLLLFASLGAVLAQHHGQIPKCGRIMHGGLECCKKEMPSLRMPPPDDIKECLAIPKKPPPSCDLEICIAKKMGTASEDGTIDNNAMEKALEDKFKDNPDLLSSVITNCLNGDLRKYGPHDLCDLMKQKSCIDVEVIKSCYEWKDDGDCNGMKDLAADCIKQFA